MCGFFASSKVGLCVQTCAAEVQRATLNMLMMDAYGDDKLKVQFAPCGQRPVNECEGAGACEITFLQEVDHSGRCFDLYNYTRIDVVSHQPYLVDQFGDPPVYGNYTFVVMGGQSRTLYFQNVYHSSAGCVDLGGTYYLPGAPQPSVCVFCAGEHPGHWHPECDEKHDMNTQLQIEPGKAPPVFSAVAYDNSTGVPVDLSVDFSNDDPLAWGRYAVTLEFGFVENVAIELQKDNETFATLQYAVRPPIVAAEVTQVVPTGASIPTLPGGADMFDDDVEEEARDQFASGIADLFGVGSDSVTIIGVPGDG